MTLSLLLYENEPLRAFQFEIADNTDDALVLRSVTAGEEIGGWTVPARETAGGSLVAFGFSPEGEETVAQSEGILLEVTFDIVKRLGSEVSFFLAGESGVLLSDADAENVACLFPTSDDPATYPVDWLAMGESDMALPTEFVLMQNYPNPFNPETTISFKMKESATVEISVFNVLGQKVVRLVSSKLPAGVHTVVWNGLHGKGRPVSSGVYIYTMKAGEFFAQKKMVLLR